MAVHEKFCHNPAVKKLMGDLAFDHECLAPRDDVTAIKSQFYARNTRRSAREARHEGGIGPWELIPGTSTPVEHDVGWELFKSPFAKDTRTAREIIQDIHKEIISLKNFYRCNFATPLPMKIDSLGVGLRITATPNGNAPQGTIRETCNDFETIIRELSKERDILLGAIYILLSEQIGVALIDTDGLHTELTKSSTKKTM